MKTFYLILISVFAVSCYTDSINNENLKEESEIIDSDNNSSEQSYIDSEFYWGNVISLDDSLSGFFYVDSTMTDQLKDKVTPDERIEYYSKIRKDIPERLLSIHKSIWALPEMKNMVDGDGGYGTRITVWEGNYSDTIKSFTVELKKDYWDRWGATIPFFSVQVSPETGHMKIVDMDLWPDGKEETIDVWRKEMQKSR